MAITRIGNPAIADIRGVNFRNIIINGGMDIAQRGTSHTTASGYTLDRWHLNDGTSGEFTVTQSTTVPTGQGFSSSYKLDCTTADASPSSSEYLIFNQRIEGQNLQYIKKGTSSAESLTLSFYVRSNKTGDYVAELRDADNTRNNTIKYTISSADTWEKKTLTFAGDTSGALDNDNARSFDVNFWLLAGSNYTSGSFSSNTWSSITDANRAVGGTNIADSTSNEWYITGIQLEAGSQASDFEFLPHDSILQKCYRYYQDIPYVFDQPICNASNYNTSTAYGVMHLFTTMRSIPSLDQASGTSYYRYYNDGNSEDKFDSFAIGAEGNNNLIRINNADTMTIDSGESGWFTMINSSSKLAFDAEL
jgi:hypothetical protein